MHASGAREHLAHFEHDHRFLGDDHVENARRATIVTGITAATMVVEIVAGWLTGSMALLADGVHMATHAGAIGVAAFAYRIAARRSEDPRLAMGAGKVGDLAGFANAIVLGLVALAIGFESIARILDPQAVAYGEAAIIAVLGLIVNIVCAILLGGHAGHDHGGSHGGHSHTGHDHAHAHGHSHAHDRGHGHAAGAKDQNLRGAYLHVLADAVTSVLAIAALGAGWAFGWRWVDPAVGVLGAGLIASWSLTLLRDTAATLTDAPADPALEKTIRARLEVGDVRICDLHLWRVGPGKVAAIVALVTHHPQPPETYKAKLMGLDALAHVTVEVNRCPGEDCAAA
ncbi:CDF family Co(II)/Ni(II) efflux transporter DmeF [Hansschlegelia quercus]|uniref:Cation transporter n=1 Tax=Hansschlegelia quercus TaxID=2528245 RepID=A0A4Q9GL18_9HYPH|nr:CDF family Co(II)/Ni(II) efflux transporter DmeF [Hansschlegelia quercus]TBN55013.1 cation transporter [Hansschlegelia quercus]